ncbi:serine/threonine protein phosphatase PrpC [Bacilli bacterium PM5-3]|nr:serine/threonine protein phosphatase PrpC [Bacilli bacterium PM5-3]MDH6603899.1 serine/threonine protein phosphatase PrpC [Bacilli bacterium PM5-9]
MKKYAITDIGKARTSNQDQAFVYTNNNGDTIGIVCDGMGGHKAGAYASLLAAKTVLDCFIDASEFESKDDATTWLYNAIMEANNKVKTKSDEEEKFKGMGTTLVITLVLKDVVMIANVGDSRVYQCINGEIRQITEDQSLVNILLKSGKINDDEAINHPNKHVLMYAIGTMEDPQVDIYELEKVESSLLMCSDGVYNLVSQTYLKTIMESSLPISQKAISIINDANSNGGYDNMAIVLMEVNQDGK